LEALHLELGDFLGEPEVSEAAEEYYDYTLNEFI